MEVKCIKLSIDTPDKFIFNGDMENFLTINSRYFVFGLRFTKKANYFYIFNGSHVIPVPFELFNIIDNTFSFEWEIKIWEFGDVTVWPSLFYAEDFFENFSDYEKRERALFEELRKKIEV